MDSDTTGRMDNDNKIIIQISQEIYKPDEYVSLISNFQVSYNGTIINTAPMKYDLRPRFVIVLPNEYSNKNVINSH